MNHPFLGRPFSKPDKDRTLNWLVKFLMLHLTKGMRMLDTHLHRHDLQIDCEVCRSTLAWSEGVDLFGRDAFDRNPSPRLSVGNTDL